MNILAMEFSPRDPALFPVVFIIIAQDRPGETGHYDIGNGRGIYLYVLEGSPVLVNTMRVPLLGAAMIAGEPNIDVLAEQDAKLLLVDVKKTDVNKSCPWPAAPGL